MARVRPCTISKLWTKYTETNDVKDRPRSGRPRVTTRETDHRIETLVTMTRFVDAREIQGEVHAPGRQRISYQTVRNRLHSVGLRFRMPAIVPAMTDDHKRLRLGWSQQHIRWTKNKWNDVLFTDESRFCFARRRVMGGIESGDDVVNDMLSALYIARKHSMEVA